MADVGVFGSSGFAREVGDIVRAVGDRPIYVVQDAASHEGLEDEVVVVESRIESLGDITFTIGIGDNRVRARIAERFGSKLRFRNLVHPSATFGYRQREAIERARGVVIAAGVRFTNGTTVEDFAIFNLNVTVGHDCHIGECANLAPGASISGNVRVGRRVWVGTGATLLQGRPDQKLDIGDDVTIGAGAVVLKDCGAGGTYVGVPAKRLG